jgi:dihydrofolate reductase
MDIVVAVNDDWGIGFKGTQSVVVPEDRKHFRSVTGKGTVIVGRKTIQDFPGGKPLKNRKNIVLTRDENLKIDGAVVVHSMDEAFSAISEDENVFIIGGDSVYKLFLPYCSRAFLTKLLVTPESDTFFPNLDETPNWSVEDMGEELTSENGVKYRFITYINNDVKSH